MATRRLKRDTAPVAPLPSGVPKCPMHGFSMGFDSESDKFRCVEKGCKITARKPEAKDDNEVTVVRGPFAIILSSTGVLLKTKKGQVVDLSDHITGTNVEDNGVGGRVAYLNLYFTDIRRA